MKKIVLAIASLAAIVALPIFSASAQSKIPTRYIATTGVGPAVAGSESATALPKKAEKFIEKMGESVTSVEREFATGEYDVKLSSGIEIEFNKHGKIVDVEAPDNGVLGSDLVREVVPHRLYSNLKDLKMNEMVSSIETQRDGGYKLEFMGGIIEEAVFSPSGDLIAKYFD